MKLVLTKRGLQTTRLSPVYQDSHIELPLDPDAAQPGAFGKAVHFTPHLVLAIFLGGVLGTAVRYYVSGNISDPKNGWPIAIFVINLSGAFILGVLLETLAKRGPDEGMRRIIRLGVGTGFLGAFTTYSTLAVDTDLLIRGGHIRIAFIYALTSMLGGILLSLIGIQLASQRYNHSHGDKK